jgi:pimeloyl-ACP methyl ester carboxylesterase
MNKLAGCVAFTLTLTAALSACSVDSNASKPGEVRGTVMAEHSASMVDFLGNHSLQPTATDLTVGAVDSSTATTLAGTAECGVTIVHLVYQTKDPSGQPATASEGLMIPKGSGANCTGPRPTLLYSHGTTTLKSYNTADPEHNPEALMVETFFAAHGYIVVMPNYLGYDVSSLPYHPYLNADVQAGDMIDGLRAARTELASRGVKTSQQLFIAGYSQGGHVAMATFRAIEQNFPNEFTVTAAAPMSGPYNLVTFGDTVTSPDGAVNIGGVLFMPYLMTSYQNSYGSIYNTPSDVYQAPFDQYAPTIFPTDTPVATLMQQGELPNDPTFRLLFGPGGLLTDSFRASYLDSNFRKALQRNTLLGWNPKAPLAMCGGSEDPTVYFTNIWDMQDDLASRGINVPVWDLEDRKSLPTGPNYGDVYDGFQLAKLKAGSDVQMHYHGEIVLPFCYTLVRGFFAQYLPST